MEMPSYEQYGNWFGQGPMSLHYGMNQMDLARQFQNQKLEQERQAVREQELANLFNEQNNPLKIQNQQIVNRRQGYEADEAGVTSRIATATEPLKLDAEQRRLVMEASKSDLDGLEISAQQMAYSPDPAIRQQGEQLLKMHRDFVKLREQARLDRENQDRQAQQNINLENLRHRNTKERTQTSGGTGGSDDKMSTDQRISFHQAQAFAALQAGNQELADRHYQQAEYLAQLRMFQRPDPNAGDPDLSSRGIAVRPERGLPPRPGVSNSPTQTPPPATLADVQRMYPGVPADKLREAYKRKFGVDLQ